jgi:hypothetical protein
MAYPTDTSKGTISSSPARGRRDGEPDEERVWGDPESNPGKLLDSDTMLVAKHAYELWKSQDGLMNRRIAQWQVNAYQRQNVPESKVIKEQDRYIAWIPDYVNEDPGRNPSMNKAATLDRKLVNQLMADPPAPEAVPASGEDVDAQAAEWSTRVLQDIQGESGLFEPGTIRRAIDRAVTHASGFVLYWVDPKGGGREPVEAKVGVEYGADGSVVREADHMDIALDDPLTDMAWPAYESRFVKKDGSFTKDRREAATQWVPTIRNEVLTGVNVRFIPHTAEDIWDAKGLQIGSYSRTWGELKEMWPDLAKLSEEEIQKILRFRPKHYKAILPDGVRLQGEGAVDEKNRDAQPVFCLTTFYAACDKYPDGIYVVTLADCYMAHRETWVLEDRESWEPLEIPVTQYKLFEEGTTDPYGFAFQQIVGPGNEIRAAQIAALFDHLDDIANRKYFIPTTSNLSGRDMTSTQKYLNTIPGGEPKAEQLPDFPAAAMEMYRLADEEMSDAAGLGMLAESVPEATSGRHLYGQISQAHAGLSEPRMHIERGYTRASRITLQLIRAFFGKERQLKWLGEDNRYKYSAWKASDLRTTKDVRLAAGSLTLLTPAQKAQFAEHLHEKGILAPGDLRDTLAKNLGGTVVLQDDPYRARIRSQLSEWAEGPPPLPDDQLAAGTELAPETIPPQALKVWEPVLADSLPQVAQVRLEEIARFMSTQRYSKHSPAWRGILEAEFQRMQQIVTPPAPPAPPQPEMGMAPPAGAPGLMDGAPVEFGITPPDQMPPEVMANLPPELQATVPTAELPVM